MWWFVGGLIVTMLLVFIYACAASATARDEAEIKMLRTLSDIP